jgi:hypothetical protein
VAPQRQAILPATLEARAEVMLLVRDVRPGERDVLRIWPAPASLGSGTPLWIGATQRMVLTRPLGTFVLWRPRAYAAGDAAPARRALSAFEHRIERHPRGTEVLRLRVPASAPASVPPTH